MSHHMLIYILPLTLWPSNNFLMDMHRIQYKKTITRVIFFMVATWMLATLESLYANTMYEAEVADTKNNFRAQVAARI